MCSLRTHGFYTTSTVRPTTAEARPTSRSPLTRQQRTADREPASVLTDAAVRSCEARGALAAIPVVSVHTGAAVVAAEEKVKNTTQAGAVRGKAEENRSGFTTEAPCPLGHWDATLVGVPRTLYAMHISELTHRVIGANQTLCVCVCCCEAFSV